jgi:hypothetical protein
VALSIVAIKAATSREKAFKLSNGDGLYGANIGFVLRGAW